MYRTTPNEQLAFEDFYLPFGGKLRGDNRWVRLTQMIPWELVDSFYAENFASVDQGAPAKPARLALGALIIKERLGVSDEEAVEQIREKMLATPHRTYSSSTNLGWPGAAGIGSCTSPINCILDSSMHTTENFGLYGRA